MYDVIVIGGGPAGLSAALTLGRARRKIVIIDEQNPRSKVIHFSHGVPTRDGVPPSEFRKAARKELTNYPSIIFKKDCVVDVKKINGHFELLTENGEEFSARKCLFATGLKDVLPLIEGFDDIYGTSAFICPYCDGWEFRDKPIAIIGHKLADIHFVKALHGWSHDLALFTNGPHDFENSQVEAFKNKNIPIYEEKIQQIEHENGVLNAIILGNGERIERHGIFFNPGVEQASLIPHNLGVSMNDGGIYQTEEDGKTKVEGLYISGDSRNHLHQIIHAASDGAKAAVSINMELLKEDWDDLSGQNLNQSP